MVNVLMLYRIAHRSTQPWWKTYSDNQEKTMPQSTHDRVAELHNLAAHAHFAAATAHGKGDHLTAHELSMEAHEHSSNARKLSEELALKAGKA
jgi:hypothetical protein